MLILSRKSNESILIGENIRITVASVSAVPRRIPAEFRPITRPDASTNGPPEKPGSTLTSLCT